MLAARPFASQSALFAEAQALWDALTVNDWLEAFAHHPEIGADLKELRKRFASSAELSESEQAGVAQASDATLLTLRRLNQAYRDRFGYSFIICASSKTAQEMLTVLDQRLTSSPAAELGVAAAERAKITRLR